MSEMCEFCGQKINLDLIKKGICICGFPISEENKDFILKKKGIENNPPAPLSTPIENEISDEMEECLKCGFPIEKLSFKKGENCPSCGKKCNEVEKPPSTIIDSKKMSDNNNIPKINTIKLIILNGCLANFKIDLPQNQNIGREFFCALTNNYNNEEFKTISSSHFIFDYQSGNVMIKDLGTLNSTLINAEKIDPEKFIPIKIGDIITIGEKISFIITNYSQLSNDENNPKYQLKDPDTNTIFPLIPVLDQKPNNIIFGREPKVNQYDPYLYTILISRLGKNENRDQLKEIFQTISRTQFELKFNIQSGSWEFINKSNKGTKIDSNLIKITDNPIKLSNGMKIEFGYKFQLIFEEI